MLKLFDTHTHYDDRAYDGDRDELLPRMLADNIAGFIAIGCSLERSEQAVRLAESYPHEHICATIGIHPQDVNDLPADYLKKLETLAASRKVVAIGETGLEYYREYDAEKQKKAFREQLDLALKLKLPVIVHSREAFPDTLSILREYVRKGIKAVCHCFSGDGAIAREFTELGIYISFTGNIAFGKKTENLIDACKNVPDELLLLETDCPYLAPPPFRGKRCDSSMAWYTAQKIAEIKNRTSDQIVEMCNNNAMRFFNIRF